MTSKKQIIDSSTAARHMGLEPETLANWRFLSRGPAYIKVGRKVVYDLDDVEAWLDSHKVEPESMNA